MKYVVLIDDEITEENLTFRNLEKIIGDEYTLLPPLNTNSKIVEFLTKIPIDDCKLVLLDLNLSKVKLNSNDILLQLKKNRMNVIVVSGVPKSNLTDGSKKIRTEGERNFVHSGNYRDKGAKHYIHKDDLDELDPDKISYYRDMIYQTIANTKIFEYKLVVDHVNKMIRIAEIDLKYLFNNIGPNWMTATRPNNNNEAILRLFYEMAKNDQTQARFDNFYTGLYELKKRLRLQLDKLLINVINILKRKALAQSTMDSLNVLRVKASSAITKNDVDMLLIVMKSILSDLALSLNEYEEIEMNELIETARNYEYTYKGISELSKTVKYFNNKIISQSNGKICSNILESFKGKGDRSGLYKANVTKVVPNSTAEVIDAPELPQSIDQRLNQLEAEIMVIKNYLKL